MQTSLIKSQKEIEILREGGARLAVIIARLMEMVRPNLSSVELENEARRLISEGGDTSSFLGYKGRGDSKKFPSVLCVSVNNEVVHGIPSENKILRDGDIVKLDLGIWHKGLCTDMAVTVPVGNISTELSKLIDTTKMALGVGIAAVRDGATIGDIGNAIEKFVRNTCEGKQVGNYGIVRDLAGHGVGYAVHEEPVIPNFGKQGEGTRLQAGMVLAIEPMLTLGAEHTKLGADGFSYRTNDNSVAAQFEHTIVVTEEGAEILTQV